MTNPKDEIREILNLKPYIDGRRKQRDTDIWKFDYDDGYYLDVDMATGQIYEQFVKPLESDLAMYKTQDTAEWKSAAFQKIKALEKQLEVARAELAWASKEGDEATETAKLLNEQESRWKTECAKQMTERNLALNKLDEARAVIKHLSGTRGYIEEHLDAICQEAKQFLEGGEQ